MTLFKQKNIIKKIMPRGIYKRTQEARKNMSESHIGNKHTKKSIKKMSTIAKEKGFGSWMKLKINEKSNNWKGDEVGYFALHLWIRKRLGKPSNCSCCGINGKYTFMKNGVKRWSIEWANKSGNYLRVFSDWIKLCRKCHKQYDLNQKHNGLYR